MRMVVHAYQEGLDRISVYQEYATPEPGENNDQFPTHKGWEGVFVVDEESKETIRLLEIIIQAGGPFQISAFFPGYEGTAIAVASVGPEVNDSTPHYPRPPVKISFKGVGVLRKHGREIENKWLTKTTQQKARGENMKCFYHSADLDGHCSGAIIKYAKPECKLIGINYGDEFPWDTIKQDEIVYMVDFCLQPFADMVLLETRCQLIWIDHHRSAIEEAHKHGFLAYEQSLEIDIGACELVWKHMSIHKVPTFVKLLAEYDVWNHTDPRTLSFQYGMRLLDTDPNNQDLWESLFDVERVHRITEDGGIILNYTKQENIKYISACGFDTELDGLKCIAINKMLTNSQVFDSVWDAQKYDAMLTFGFRKGKWTVSLYSDKDDIDVSAIAKNRGGGGHKGASGFQCSVLPFALE